MSVIFLDILKELRFPGYLGNFTESVIQYILPCGLSLVFYCMESSVYECVANGIVLNICPLLLLYKKDISRANYGIEFSV